VSTRAEAARPLDVDDVHETLGPRAARSGVVVFGGRVVQGVVSLVSIAILARILTPSDFGVLAMVVPLALIVDMTINAGLHVAVMHEARLTNAQVSRLFWIAQRFNVLLLGAMAVSAPLVARLYGEPRVTSVVLFWTVALAFDAIGAFPESVLKREIRFGVLTLLDVGGMIVGAGVAIAAASLGWRHVALVLQFVVWKGVRCVGAFAAARWLPDRPSRHADFDVVVDRLVRYGAHFGGSRAVYWLGRQIDRMVLGYMSGAAVLGLYDSARRWSWYPFQELFLAITDVAVASLSRTRQSSERFREYCRRGFTAFLSLPLPAIAFVGVEADLVVRVLLGEQWVSAVPMVRILSAAAFVDAIARLTTWLYVAEGRTRDQLRWSLVSASATSIAVLAAGRSGATAVTWAFAASTVGLALPGIAYCLRTSVLGPWDFVRAVWRPAAAAAFAAGLWLLARVWMPGARSPIVTLAIAALVFAWLYALAWRFMPGGRQATRDGLGVLGAAVRRPASRAA
jgi:O-antigen/teichoic acid export membrane protein